MRFKGLKISQKYKLYSIITHWLIRNYVANPVLKHDKFSKERKIAYFSNLDNNYYLTNNFIVQVLENNFYSENNIKILLDEDELAKEIDYRLLQAILLIHSEIASKDISYRFEENYEYEQKVRESQDKYRNRIYLNVPYEEKDQAHELGAKFDGRKIMKRWYITPELDISKFEKWLLKK